MIRLLATLTIGAALLFPATLTLAQETPVTEDRKRVLADLYADDEDAKSKVAKVDICNKGQVAMDLALYRREEVDSPNFIVEGWLPLKAGACLTLPDVPRGDFAMYALAKNNKTHVTRDDRRLCVKAGNFRRVYDPGYSCAKRFVKGFVDYHIDSETYTITIN